MPAGHRCAAAYLGAVCGQPLRQTRAQRLGTHVSFLLDPQPGGHGLRYRRLEVTQFFPREHARRAAMRGRAGARLMEHRPHRGFPKEDEQQPGAMRLEVHTVGGQRVEGLHHAVRDDLPGPPSGLEVVRVAMPPE